MKKSKSFSAYGKYLENRASLSTNPQILMRNSQRAKQNPMKVTKADPKWIQGFDRVPGRDKPSSFLLFNTKDFCNQANYQLKEQLVKTRSSFFPIRKEKQQRLNKLIFNREYEKAEHACPKCPEDGHRDQNILTTRDLQKLRKSHHSMDFKKQIDRTNTYIKKPVTQQQFDESNNFNSTTRSKFEPAPKLSKAHSFESYTKRDFLSEKKVSLIGAPFYSGAESFRVPMEKYKGSWKTINPQQFSKSPKKLLSRYDATNDPFYTKLGYQPKEELVTKRSPVMDMSQQTARKLNEVHSKYPIRLTV